MRIRVELHVATFTELELPGYQYIGLHACNSNPAMIASTLNCHSYQTPLDGITISVETMQQWLGM